jgi:5-methylcytosine-specific restriction endonuclease McrA
MNRQQAGNQKRQKAAERLWEKRRAEVEWLYLDQQWSQEKIARYFGVALAGIQKAMKRLGIKSRPRANLGSRNGRYKDGKQTRLYRTLIQKDKCSVCEATETLGIHHRNGDHYDNRLDNLQVLCNSCHMRETKRLWWKAKKAGLPTPKSNGPVGWLRSPIPPTGPEAGDELSPGREATQPAN